MALRITAIVAFLVLFVCYGEATDYMVGDTQLWTFGVNYTIWASTKTFVVGDNLVFEYTDPVHNVLEVNKTAYDSCEASNPRQEYIGGSTNITLSSEGTRYFICGKVGHCGNGMKVAVTVSASSSVSPITPATPSPPTETDSTHGNAGHVAQMKDVWLLLFGSLIMRVILI